MPALIVSGLAFFTIHSSMAQGTDFEARDKYNTVSGVTNTVTTNTQMVFDQSYEGIKGHPYLFGDWKNATLRLDNGKVYDGIPILLDLEKDQVLFKPKTLDVQVLDAQIVESIEMEGLKFQYLNLSEGTKLSSGFYLLFYTSDQFMLYERRSKFLERRQESSAYNYGPDFDDYKYYPRKYVLIDKEGPKDLKRSLRGVARVLGKEVDIKEYLKGHKNFDIDREEDFIDLLAFYSKKLTEK
ncbi:hypothetical protein [Reichenbachiella ulvae]|uniref:Uncharacterized protein n=1 Tax=Reichenbachiella ulvae TaxID=2980104 RepID=A0ABT3CZW3_9BACT|nr:hypothetical protein [Reichenbachiella ulvae]MCV9389040.1 hypothetical protein [Reichenbachiella ulvae]